MQASDYYPLMPKKMLDNMLMKAVDKHNYEKVAELLDYGANPNSEMLNIAIVDNQENIVELLLEYRANPDEKSLYYTISNDKYKLTKMLLDYGADPNKTYGVSTPIVYAILYGRWDVVKLLLKYGADPHKEMYGINAFDIPESRGIKFMQIYKEFKACPVMPFLMSSHTKNPKLPKDLVRNLKSFLKFSRKKSKSRLRGKRIYKNILKNHTCCIQCLLLYNSK